MSILCPLAKNSILWCGSMICHFPLYISRDSTHARILKFQKIPDTLVHDVTYTNRYASVQVVHLCWFLRLGLYNFFYRLAFTKAERMPPPEQNEELWILSLDPKVVQKVNVCSIDLWDGISLYASTQASQETMLVQDPNKPEIYSFAVRIHILMLWFL